MAGACKDHGEMRNAYEILVAMSEGKVPLVKPRPRR
jgi:hypothetical protein